jgi:catechol 2,3-dioxygenase-like lactoylglutathione lyase family enzyme
MADHAAPNLPSRDFEATSRFYAKLGFVESWRDAEWMILRNGGLTLEFFPHPKLDPAKSWFSCCLRFDKLQPFYDACKRAGIPEAQSGFPHIDPPKRQDWGGTIANLIDIDGTLLRLIQAD